VRICSLVPAATEVLYALGLGESVVGVTHECDWPPEAAALPAVTASIVDSETLGSKEIDRLVTDASRAGRPLYAVDEERWNDVRADVVVAQQLCDVCAVSSAQVRKLDVEVLDYSPTTLAGIGRAVVELGGALGAGEAAAEVVRAMDERIGGVRPSPRRPRVFVAEWLDPPFAAGHWVPEMVERAGGAEVLGRAGEPSFRTTWSDVAARLPELVVLAPCGFDRERTLAEAAAVGGLPKCPAVAVDANAYFSRPGPRVAEGVELLATLLATLAAGDLEPGLVPR
jgi:iron complex transport system substrate-binding protein